MLTEEQFFINNRVKEKVKEDIELYAFNLETAPGQSPYYDFPYYELENHKNLKLMLDIEDRKQEFIINSLYYLLDQVVFYKNNNIPTYIAKELAYEDLKNIYKSYNNTRITL